MYFILKICNRSIAGYIFQNMNMNKYKINKRKFMIFYVASKTDVGF